MTYKVQNHSIYFGDSIVGLEQITEKLNSYDILFGSLKKSFNKHDIKHIAGNLRFLADYFDEDDKKTGIENKEVQECLNKAANMFNFIFEKVSEV